jgi:hypothetical protein
MRGELAEFYKMYIWRSSLPPWWVVVVVEVVTLTIKEKYKLVTTTTHKKMGCGDGHHMGKLVVVSLPFDNYKSLKFVTNFIVC